jgi:hypothetical protein
VSDRVRIEIPAFHRAGVVPKGARNPRPMVFGMQVPVDIETVRAADLAVGARAVLPKEAGAYDYLVHGSRLFVPVRAGPDPSAPTLRADDALASFAANRDLHPETGVANPFARIGPRWIPADERAGVGRIDEMFLRSVEWDEREALAAEIHRLAGDFRVDDRGRLLRASPGPHWGAFNVWSIEPNPCLFDHPRGVSSMFHATRKEEARDHLTRHVSGKVRASHSVYGDIEIGDVGALPDRDALNTAYGLFSPGVFAIVDEAAQAQDEDLRALAEPVFRGFELLWGSPRSIAADPRFRWAVPFGMPAPEPAHLAARVDDLRTLFSEMRPRNEPNDRGVRDDMAVAQFRAALVRWDEYELPRLVLDDPAPDLPFDGPSP